MGRVRESHSIYIYESDDDRRFRRSKKQEIGLSGMSIGLFVLCLAAIIVAIVSVENNKEPTVEDEAHLNENTDGNSYVWPGRGHGRVQRDQDNSAYRPPIGRVPRWEDDRYGQCRYNQGVGRSSRYNSGSYHRYNGRYGRSSGRGVYDDYCCQDYSADDPCCEEMRSSPSSDYHGNSWQYSCRSTSYPYRGTDCDRCDRGTGDDQCWGFCNNGELDREVGMIYRGNRYMGLVEPDNVWAFEVGDWPRWQMLEKVKVDSTVEIASAMPDMSSGRVASSGLWISATVYYRNNTYEGQTAAVFRIPGNTRPNRRPTRSSRSNECDPTGGNPDGVECPWVISGQHGPRWIAGGTPGLFYINEGRPQDIRLLGHPRYTGTGGKDSLCLAGVAENNGYLTQVAVGGHSNWEKEVLYWVERDDNPVPSEFWLGGVGYEKSDWRGVCDRNNMIRIWGTQVLFNGIGGIGFGDGITVLISAWPSGQSNALFMLQALDGNNGAYDEQNNGVYRVPVSFNPITSFFRGGDAAFGTPLRLATLNDALYRHEVFTVDPLPDYPGWMAISMLNQADYYPSPNARNQRVIHGSIIDQFSENDIIRELPEGRFHGSHSIFPLDAGGRGIAATNIFLARPQVFPTATVALSVAGAMALFSGGAFYESRRRRSKRLKQEHEARKKAKRSSKLGNDSGDGNASDGSDAAGDDGKASASRTESHSHKSGDNKQHHHHHSAGSQGSRKHRHKSGKRSRPSDRHSVKSSKSGKSSKSKK